MKRFSKLFGRGLFIALSIFAMISVVASAAPMHASTAKSLSTNYTVVNLNPDPAGTAHVVANYIKPDGSTWTATPANTSFNVSGNFGQQVIAQYFDTAMTPGKGSVVLNSDQPLGAVVQILARGQTPTSGAYTGISTPSTKYYVPQVQRNRGGSSGLANTQIAIQSAVDTGTENVTVDFIPYPGSGFAAFSKTNITLNANASFLYDVADESATNLPDGWYGSAVVREVNGKNIAVVVNIFAGNNSLSTFNGFPQEMVTSSWSVPQFTSRLPNGLSTPVVIQNLSGGTLANGAISMSCKSSISTPATFTATSVGTVANNAAYAFSPVSDTTLPGNWSGACRVTVANNAGVVAYVQMRRPGVTDEFAAYEAFPSNSTNTRVVVPLVSKRQANGFATAVTIQNLDAANAAQVTLTYTPSAAYVSGGGSATPIVFNATIAADGNIIQSHRITGGDGSVPQMPDGWYGTLLVAPQAGQTARPIVAFIQLTNWQGAAGDTFMAHDAFSLP